MKTTPIERLLQSSKHLVLSGAGIVGERVMEFCRQQGLTVVAVCDGSTRVAGTVFHGHTVIHTSRLAEQFDDALVLISVAAIKDVVDSLQTQGLTDWVAAGPLLEDMDINQNDPELDYAKFSIESCITIHRGFLDPEKTFLRSVDIIITERCSLKCKDCANLMQYYERPRNVPLDLVFQSIDALCSLTDEIMEMRVIGGDAFMNKDWPQVVKKLTDEPKIKRVLIYTNGTIVPSSNTIEILKHTKVYVIVTDYGTLSRNLGRLRTFLTEHTIAHRILGFDSWLDCASIGKHDRPPEENARVYQECCAKNMLSLSDGKLFRCPFAANADRLAAVPEFPTDYVDVLSEAASQDALEIRRKRLTDYVLHKDTLKICDYCDGRPLAGKEVTPAVQISKPLLYQRHSRTKAQTSE
ncbi:MAG: hypothetical protein WCL27_01105 [Betaproteobacteria bacterium]